MAKADLYFCGFETGDLSQVFTTSGTVSASSSTKRTGGYALRCNPSAAASQANFRTPATTGKLTVMNRTAETFYTFYVYVASLPGGTTDIAYIVDTVAGTVTASLRLTSAGVLTGNGATASATVATLSTATWYRIDWRVTSNSTCGVKVDGGTEQTYTAQNQEQDEFGLGHTTGAQTYDIFYDDLVIGTTACDAGVGPCVRMAVPVGAGNTAQWVDGTGTTFAEVDDAPHDSATTILTNTSGTSQSSTFDMQTAATVGIVGTIYALMSCAIMAETSSTTTSGGVRLRSGSIDSDNTAVDIGNTSYVPIQKVFATDPQDAAAWTNTKFDACEVGPFKGSDNSSIRCTAVYLHVCEDGVAAGGGGLTHDWPEPPLLTRPWPMNRAVLVQV